MSEKTLTAIAAAGVAAETGTIYPVPFRERVAGREKRRLGQLFGLKSFGVNLTRLPVGAMSSLRHRHLVQDEFIYVLEGTPVLITDQGETALAPGSCAGFPAGGTAHHLVNRGPGVAVYLEIGDRQPGDRVEYPDDDLAIAFADGRARVTHKDGTSY
jgi:uncharacterized cupin superfamily protein